MDLFIFLFTNNFLIIKCGYLFKKFLKFFFYIKVLMHLLLSGINVMNCHKHFNKLIFPFSRYIMRILDFTPTLQTTLAWSWPLPLTWGPTTPPCSPPGTMSPRFTSFPPARLPSPQLAIVPPSAPHLYQSRASRSLQGCPTPTFWESRLNFATSEMGPSCPFPFRTAIMTSTIRQCEGLS